MIRVINFSSRYFLLDVWFKWLMICWSTIYICKVVVQLHLLAWLIIWWLFINRYKRIHQAIIRPTICKFITFIMEESTSLFNKFIFTGEHLQKWKNSTVIRKNNMMRLLSTVNHSESKSCCLQASGCYPCIRTLGSWP